MEGQKIDIYLKDISSSFDRDPSDFNSLFIIMPMKG